MVQGEPWGLHGFFSTFRLACSNFRQENEEVWRCSSLSSICWDYVLNGYRPDKLKFLPNRNAPRSSDAPDKPIAVLPYIGHTSHKIQRILREADIKAYYRTRNKLETKLHTHKDRPDPSDQAGVYRIPCTCGKVYIGETGRDLTTRLNEHKAHGRRGECDKSAIIKHSTDSDHVIDWQKAEIIAPEKHWYTRRIREAIEIHKHDTVPQDIGYFISSIWHPILPSINTHTPQSTDTPQRTGNSHTAGIPHTHNTTMAANQNTSHHSGSIRHTPPGTNQNTSHSTHNPSRLFSNVSCCHRRRHFDARYNVSFSHIEVYFSQLISN